MLDFPAVLRLSRDAELLGCGRDEKPPGVETDFEGKRAWGRDVVTIEED